MTIPPHHHKYELATATKADIAAGVSDKLIVTPSVLGSACACEREEFATAEQGKLAQNAVPNARQIHTTGLLSGGGSLSQDLTLKIDDNALTEKIKSLAPLPKPDPNAVPKSRKITVGWGLIGSGTLDKDLFIDFGNDTRASLDKANKAAPSKRKITVGYGLIGGGTLEKDILIDFGGDTRATLRRADNSVQRGEVKALGYKDKAELNDIKTLNPPMAGAYLGGDGWWHTPGFVQPYAAGGCPYLPEGIMAHDWLELTPSNNVIAQVDIKIDHTMAFYVRGSCEVVDLSGRPYDGDSNKQDIVVWDKVNKKWAFRMDSHVGIMLDNRPTRCTREISFFLPAGDYTFSYLMLFTAPTNKGRRPAIIRKRRKDNFVDNAVPQILVYKFWDT